MRRLWAHVLLASAALVLVGATFNSVFTHVDSNIEFSNGQEITFKVSDKNDSGEFIINPDEDENEETPAQNIAAVMENRLKTYGVSRYQVVTEGNDIVKVVLAEEKTEIQKIETFLMFDGTLAISCQQGDYAEAADFLTGEPAYFDTINDYPTVVIPVNTENEQYQLVFNNAKDSDGETTTTGEGEDATETTTKYMYLWYNFIADVDSYEASKEDTSIANKILMKINVDSPYYPDGNDNKLASTLNVDGDGDGNVTPAEIKNAYSNAHYFVNLINAGGLDYSVTLIYENTASLWVESLFNYSNTMTVSFSSTFKATLIAIAMIAIVLIAFFRLGSLSVSAVTISSAYASLLILIGFGVDFNIATLIGFVCVAVASLASGIIYLCKLKDEAYKGRTLKKANAEAGKKALLPTIDIHVGLILLGVFCYILGDVVMKGFALVTVLGGLCSFVLNAIGLRGLMWLATNSTKLQGQYDKFGISNDKVPNLMNEEKQSYFGPYADKDLTKKKKLVSVIMSVLTVAAAAGMIVFGVMDNNQVYVPVKENLASEIFIEAKADKEDDISTYETAMRGLFETIEENVHFKGEDKTLKDYVADSDNYSASKTEYTNGEAKTTYYTYYVITLDKALTGEEEIYYEAEGNACKLNELFTNDQISTFAIYGNDDLNFSYKTSEISSPDQPYFFSILLATGVALGAMSIYLMLRYRLSRGLAALIISVCTTAITAGIFALARVPVGSYTVAILPFVALFSLIAMIIYMNREREIINDDRTRNNSVENRNAIMVKALAYSFEAVLILASAALFIVVLYFGFGPHAYLYPFVLGAVGIGLTILFNSIVAGPLSQALFAQFAKVNLNKPSKRASSKKKVVNKSAEPEEAIFIGIND